MLELVVLGLASGAVADLLVYPFGFALLVQDRLGYFRIQNHLRRTGLGASALRRLVQDHPELRPSPSPWLPSEKLEGVRARDIDHVNELLQIYRLQHAVAERRDEV